MRYCFIHTWITVMKKSDNSSIDENEEKLEHSHTADRNVKWYSHFGKQPGSYPKVELSLTQQFYF